MLRYKIAAFSIAAQMTAFAPEIYAESINILTMTENSSDSLGVVFSELAFPTLGINGFDFTGNLTFPGNDTWLLGGIPIIYPQDVYDGSNNAVPFVAWREPENTETFNLLHVKPDGNQGVTTLLMYSELTLTQMMQLGFATCRFSGALGQCPILNDGESYDIATLRLGPGAVGFVDGGVLKVTFTDRGDTAVVPLPAAFPLFAAGLAVFGRRVRRSRAWINHKRYQRAQTARAAPAQAQVRGADA